MRKQFKILVLAVIVSLALIAVFVPIISFYGTIGVSTCDTLHSNSGCGKPSLSSTGCISHNPKLLCDQLYLSVSYWAFGVGLVYQADQPFPGFGGVGTGFFWSPTRT